MAFKESAATKFIPTLARLILAAACITAGWNKLSTTIEVEGEDASILWRLEIIDDGDLVTEDEVQARISTTPIIQLASYQDSDGDVADADPIEEMNNSETSAQPADDQVENAEPKDPAANNLMIPDGVFQTKSLYRITILLDNAGYSAKFPDAKWLAWIAALTEFIGGVLLLVGMFSRFWAIGLTIAMGCAFYLVTLPMLQAHSFNLFSFAQANQGADFNAMFTQLGLGVLTLGIVLTGPGPLSVDRILFRRRVIEDIDDITID